jgi:hypothetical protein
MYGDSATTRRGPSTEHIDNMRQSQRWRSYTAHVCTSAVALSFDSHMGECGVTYCTLPPCLSTDCLHAEYQNVHEHIARCIHIHTYIHPYMEACVLPCKQRAAIAVPAHA